MRRVTVLLLLVAALAACTPPQPAPPPTTTSAAATPTPRVQLPPRPRDIPIDDIDPCTLLTDAQRAELDLDGRPIATSTADGSFGPTRECTLGGIEPREVIVSIALATENGIELFTLGPVSAEISAIDVRGHPAVLARPTVITDFCSVEIDIAPGQFIDIQFGQGRPSQPIPQDQLCLDAQQVAEQVMITLLAR